MSNDSSHKKASKSSKKAQTRRSAPTAQDTQDFIPIDAVLDAPYTSTVDLARGKPAVEHRVSAQDLARRAHQRRPLGWQPGEAEAALLAEREAASQPMNTAGPLIGYDPERTARALAEQRRSAPAVASTTRVVDAYPAEDYDDEEDEDEDDEEDEDRFVECPTCHGDARRCGCEEEEDEEEEEDDEEDEGVSYDPEDNEFVADAERSRAYVARSQGDTYDPGVPVVGMSDMPPVPVVGPRPMSRWFFLTEVFDAKTGDVKYPHLQGYAIRVWLDQELEFLEAAEAVQKASRDARKASVQAGRKIDPKISTFLIKTLLRQLVARTNYPDRNRPGEALPQPPHGISRIDLSLLGPTFEAAMEAYSLGKPTRKPSKRRLQPNPRTRTRPRSR